MSMELCAFFGEICRDDVAWAGGKGANLGDMAQAGLAIPQGYVICAPAYHEAIRCSGIHVEIDRLLVGVNYDSARLLEEAEVEIRALFEQLEFDKDLRRLIIEKYRLLGTDIRVAVRSSATAEDLAGASFAGQQETILNVVGEDALLDSVRRCWSSLYTSQAMFYRRQKGFGAVDVSMAVVVQKMVTSEKSGVIFTVDPVMRNPYNMVIEAVWGLGEGIVSGAITPDHYRVDRETYEVLHEFVPDKPVMFCLDGDYGVAKVKVPPEQVSARVISSGELTALVDAGNHVEAHFGSPQDIEWSIEAGELYMLQSRPITSL